MVQLFRSVLMAPLVVIAFLVTTTLSQAAEITLFAAASTTNALTAVAAAFNATALNSGGQDKLRLVFASTSTLARQIANGAPADLFLAANGQWMDYLNQHGAIDNDSRIDLLHNRLVLIAPAKQFFTIKIEPDFPLAEALGKSRLAIGDPGHVPAGIYAKAALEKLGVWQDVARKVAFAGDVRAALALVDRGEAAAGIVYATDAAISNAIKVAGEFPIDSHPAIAYPLAIVDGRVGGRVGGPRNSAVDSVYRFLRGPEAQAIFRDHGFDIPLKGN